MEGRIVLAALVTDVLSGTADTAVVGTVYEDLNSNGLKDNGEDGIAGWRVYLDLDHSGTLNTDAVGTLEPSADTNGDGDFVINHLIAGNYRVAEVVPAGWTPTSPVSQDVTVVQSHDTRVNFFNFSGGEIVGTVWNDLSIPPDGIRDGSPGAYTDPGLANWTVFLDLNDNRAFDADEPSTLTGADGSYSFTNLPPGDYEVTEVLPAGWDVSPMFDIRQTAGVVARQQVVQDFANFSTSNGSIQGTIWNDVNADGIREADPSTGDYTEPGLEGWTVYLDLNNNLVADAGEPTSLTDANGDYAFISLAAGDYEVTEVLPSGWNVSPTYDVRQTVAVFGGAASPAGDFANFTVQNGSIRGVAWNDVNRNGVRDINALTGEILDPALADWTVFLDLNRNRIKEVGEPTTLTDANGGYAFTDLQIGDYEVQEVLPSGWEVSTTFSDSQTVTVFSGVESVARDFANFNVAASVPGSVSGVVWNDINGNGLREAGDAGLSGWTVFIDQNADGVLGAGEPEATSGADGAYSFSGVATGSVSIYLQSTVGWRATAPVTSSRSIALKSGETALGLDFGVVALKDSSISGVIFADKNKDGNRTTGERGLAGISVYLDLNDNSILDAGEPETQTSADLYYTPSVDEAGAYRFTHLAQGTFAVRAVFPAVLDATPVGERTHVVTIGQTEDRTGVDFAAVFRPNEIHGTQYDDVNGNHLRDAGEAGVGGTTIFVDLNRNNSLDPDEPTTVTLPDGSYSFTDLSPGAYVIREIVSPGYTQTSPTTVGGILWPSGVSNAAVGIVSPIEITTSLAVGESHRKSVSITLPTTGALTNLVDVFLLFDDTGSFVNNSPIVRAAFPDIISQLQASLTGIDLGFGVGRFEEYANFASEYSNGRPFVLNQPIVAASTSGYMSAIQAALNRTAPGYGGDEPETDIEALYQLVTGLGFDGNNNGSVLDSGPAGLASTQISPGGSGDVPSFASFTADVANSVMLADGNLGGGGFRAGALPIVLLATDTGFAYQPMGETSVTGLGGLTLPIGSLTQTSRATTPFNSGAGLQETITGLNALGALVIGLGTNDQSTLDPRQGLESISKLTGATNQSTATIANGTTDPIAPGDPLYFQIASGFSTSVSNGIVSAIQNAVTNVAMNITVQASDPRVHIINHSGVINGVGAGATATFDIEFVGDGIPRRFDLRFVRAGTNVVLGSIPVVIGTPIPGDGYEFEDLDEGEICDSVDFGNSIDEATTVIARHIFYNQSKFDGTNAAINASDDNAIATDKVALQFSGSTTAPLTAFTSYSRGINGIMVDIENAAGALNLDDFTFKVGTSSTVGSWINAPTPLGFSVRAGEGVGGSDRVEIIWANNAIQNSWLQVIVEGNDTLGGGNTNTGLAISDVFFFGNKIGDTFISSPATIVSTAGADGLAVRNNPGILQPITNVYDFDRNQTVSGGDELIARNNPGILTRNLTWSPPAAPLMAEDGDGSGSAVASALAMSSGGRIEQRGPSFLIPDRHRIAARHNRQIDECFREMMIEHAPAVRKTKSNTSPTGDAFEIDDQLLEDLIVAR